MPHTQGVLRVNRAVAVGAASNGDSPLCDGRDARKGQRPTGRRMNSERRDDGERREQYSDASRILDGHLREFLDTVAQDLIEADNIGGNPYLDGVNAVIERHAAHAMSVYQLGAAVEQGLRSVIPAPEAHPTTTHIKIIEASPAECEDVVNEWLSSRDSIDVISASTEHRDGRAYCTLVFREFDPDAGDEDTDESAEFSETS